MQVKRNRAHNDQEAPAPGSRRRPAARLHDPAQERSRFWEVIDPVGELVYLTVYKRGAVEVVRRLEA
jgi:hypothetical protein